MTAEHDWQREKLRATTDSLVVDMFDDVNRRLGLPEPQFEKKIEDSENAENETSVLVEEHIEGSNEEEIDDQDAMIPEKKSNGQSGGEQWRQSKHIKYGISAIRQRKRTRRN